MDFNTSIDLDIDDDDKSLVFIGFAEGAYYLKVRSFDFSPKRVLSPEFRGNSSSYDYSGDLPGFLVRLGEVLEIVA